MRDLLLIGVVFLGSLVALGRPFIGLLFFVFLGLFSPQSMTWGAGRSLPFSMVVGAATFVGYLVGKEPKRIPLQRESVILLALWGFFCVTTVFAIRPVPATNRLIHVSKILFMIFLCTSLVSSERRLRSLLTVISLSIGFYGLKGGIFSVMSGGSYLVWGPELSWYGANNSVGLAMSANLPFLFYLHRSETRRWLRWILMGMFLFSIPAIIFTYSRGAWLGTAVALVIILLQSRRKVLAFGFLGLAAILVVPLIVTVLPQRLFDRYDQLENWKEDPSAISRFWNWEMCQRVGVANPLHGGGFDYYSIEAYEKYFPEFLTRFPGKIWSCHSVWLTIFAEHGFPGIILWVFLIVSCLASTRRILKFEKARDGTGALPVYAPIVNAFLFVYMVSGTFLDAAYYDVFYYVVAVVIACKELFLKAPSDKDPVRIYSSAPSV